MGSKQWDSRVVHGSTRRLGTLLLAGLIWIPAASGALAEEISGLPDGPRYQILDSEQATEIPFELYYSLVVVSVTVNGSPPRDFLLDTGFQSSILNADRCRDFGLEPDASRPVEVPGGRSELASVDRVTLGLPGVEMFEPHFQVMPLSGPEMVPGRPVWGILGHPFFESFVVTLDYARRVLEVRDPGDYSHDGRGELVPLVFEENQAFLTAEIEQPGRKPVPAQLKIDTGGIDVLGLNGSFVRAMDLMNPGQERIPALGAALGGKTENWVTRVGALRVARLRLERPVVGYSVDLERVGDAGTIGAEFLRRFRIVFDYSRGRMFLAPNKNWDDPFEFDMSGIFPIAIPPNFRKKVVLGVSEDSPAKEAGVAENDVLLKLDGEDAGDMSIAEIRRIFETEGRTVELRVLRGDKELQLSVVLRRRI